MRRERPGLIRPLFALLLAMPCMGLAFAESGGEAAVKTAFLFNFFKFIDWPGATINHDNYTLCTTANDQLGDTLAVLENKTVNDKPLLIHRDISGDELKKCLMVFISASENTENIANSLKDLPIVTVSDKPDFIANGGMIGLVQDGNRLSFEVELDVAKANGVYISARLLKLAKTVKAAK